MERLTMKRAVTIGVFLFIIAGSWAYTLATRLTNLLYASRADKILILASFLIITLMFATLLFSIILPHLLGTFQKKMILMMMLICIFIIAGVFSFVYQPPPFPEQHSLTVTTTTEKNPLSNGYQVEITSISTVSLPEKNERKIPTSQFTYNGDWQRLGDSYSLSSNGVQSISIQLIRFMQAGLKIKLQTGPQSGKVQIIWDNKDLTLDLYTPESGMLAQDLQPALDWRQADHTRKILIAGALMADFLGALAILFFFASIIAFFISGNKLQVRNSKLLLICLVVLLVMQIIVVQFNKPVIFENPKIERLIRLELKKPEGNIYQRQLLTIVDLDASKRNITDISGIELLPNLIEINLRDNQIVDISPLAKLHNLQKLDLRNNRITNIEPLAQLQKLEYLNIHSNLNVRSIEPLKNLRDLKTLILANVPIKDEIDALEDLEKLTYLNVRNCGVDSLEIISNLSNLEYLNLHSNPIIASIESMQNLIKLRTLILANIPIGVDLDSIGSLAKLRYLNLRNTDLEDISVLSGLTKLEYLNLHSNQEISSIQPIWDHLDLQHLILRNVPIGNQTDILNNFLELKELNIRNCGISDVTFLGEMMGKGALQDNRKTNSVASIDIRNNPIPDHDGDQYASIRPFWENISLKYPVELPFFADLDPPIFSHDTGLYQEDFYLSITQSETRGKIYYTLDSSEPTKNSQIYSEPIHVTNHDTEPDTYSAIESISADWKKPETLVNKAVIVRAKAIDNTTGDTSPVITQTYFVSPDIQNRYTMPIISIASDPKHLFDEESGIYLLGKDYIAAKDAAEPVEGKLTLENFHRRGREWERPIYIELIEKNGRSIFSQNAGVRIHGSSSRQRPQKSLRIIARPEYDYDGLFTYPLFSADQTSRDLEYQTVLLRNSGQDWMVSMIRDTLAQNLMKHTLLTTQESRPVIVFLNGEYWGIYHLQERIDEYYLSNHFGIRPEESVILRNNQVIFRGEEEDFQHYSSMVKFIQENELSIPENYEYIKTQIDIDNYIDYMIANIYLGNTDWPHNNLYYWRKTTDAYNPNAPYGQDGRWRWMLFDLDFSFGFTGIGGGVTHNTLALAQKDDWTGLLFRSLLENEDFRISFINRFCDHMNSTFTPERVISVIDNSYSELKPEMREFFARWNSRESAFYDWENEVEYMREFSRKRTAIVLQQLTENFSLNGSFLLTLQTNSERGYIKSNSLEITSELPGVENPMSWSGTFFKGMPITVTAIPYPGYEFKEWNGYAESAEAEITIDSVEDLTLTAIFEKK